jgi:hypothetical protein
MIMLPIPPVIAWTVGAIGAVVMSKLLAREWRRVNDELDSHERAAKVRVEERGTLRRDPATGVYRPE